MPLYLMMCRMQNTAEPIMTGKRFLRPNEAAEYLGVRPQTLARWRCEGGKIPFARMGRAVVYDIADLDAFAASQKRLSTTAAA